MYLQVEHSFAFEYDAFISESFLELRVQPKTTPQQAVASFELAVGPPTSVHRAKACHMRCATSSSSAAR